MPSIAFVIFISCSSFSKITTAYVGTLFQFFIVDSAIPVRSENFEYE